MEDMSKKGGSLVRGGIPLMIRGSTYSIDGARSSMQSNCAIVGNPNSRTTFGKSKRPISSARSQQQQGTSVFHETALKSKEMLARIKRRKYAIAEKSNTSSYFSLDEITKALHNLLVRNHKNGTSTEEILEFFNEKIAPKDKLVFRDLLRQMAVCEARKWKLKKKYVT